MHHPKQQQNNIIQNGLRYAIVAISNYYFVCVLNGIEKETRKMSKNGYIPLDKWRDGKHVQEAIYRANITYIHLISVT